MSLLRWSSWGKRSIIISLLSFPPFPILVLVVRWKKKRFARNSMLIRRAFAPFIGTSTLLLHRSCVRHNSWRTRKHSPCRRFGSSSVRKEECGRSHHTTKRTPRVDYFLFGSPQSWFCCTSTQTKIAVQHDEEHRLLPFACTTHHQWFHIAAGGPQDRQGCSLCRTVHFSIIPRKWEQRRT